MSFKSCCFSSVYVGFLLCCLQGLTFSAVFVFGLCAQKENTCFTLIQKMGELIFFMRMFEKKSWEISIQVVNKSARGMWKGEQ